MNSDYKNIIEKLLDMNPDPIPHFVLLKNFLCVDPESDEYQNAYEKVCDHPFVKKITEKQNDKGYWEPFHGDTEGIIRKLLWFGLDTEHICLKKAKDYTVKLLLGEEPHDRSEKQDNIRWWPELFMPLCVSGTLSLMDNNNKNLEIHRKRWAYFTEVAFTNKNTEMKYIKSENTKRKTERKTNANPDKIRTDFFAPIDKEFNSDEYVKTQCDYFGFKTTRIIQPFNLFCLYLLAPLHGNQHLSIETDQALIDYGMTAAVNLYYVYNRNPGELIPLNAQNRDSRDFWHWIRALSLISQFKGWAKYEDKYTDWIMNQRDENGLWTFPKKHDWLGLSDSWRGTGKTIDSTIFVLRMLMKKQAL